MTSPGKFVIFPSHLSKTGWSARKWPTGFNNERVTKISVEEDAKLKPTFQYDLTPEEWQLSIKELLAKYPPPESKIARGEAPPANLSKNTREVSE
jgi:hypothetical protein